jgi:thiol-disulfide isomerase/thioredoxin
MKLSKTRREILAGLGALALPLSAAAIDEVVPRPWPRGRATPPLDLERYAGARWNLASARGRVVLVHFWYSTCDACLTELPSLERLQALHGKDGLAVVAVNFHEADSALTRFMARTPTTLPVLRDREGEAADAWGVHIFPTTIAVGRDGKAAFSAVGEVDWTGRAALQWIGMLL